jgi:hypothetical protein
LGRKPQGILFWDFLATIAVSSSPTTATKVKDI